jgi:hypothetical protein
MKIEKNEKIFIGMIVLIIVVLVGAYYLIPYLAKDGLPASLGLFGDQFGAVNALFSGLAFAGLIYTILLQKEELKAQREELTLTRQEIEGQKLELKAQNETLALQRFENSFFQLLGYYTHAKEKNFYSESYSGFKNKYNQNSGNNQGAEERYRDEFKSANNRYGSFSSYFVILRELVDYVDGITTIDDTQKKFYIDIICASLSDHELWLLFYSILYDPRLSALKESVEKYSMFENLKTDGLISPQQDKVKYSDTAYSLRE